MREILFRGKRTDNGEWIEGCFLDKNNIGIFYDDTEESDCSVHIFPVVPKTIGQYTGLTDKNGKKIFEGDIVRCVNRNIDEDDGNALIEWDKECSQFEIAFNSFITDFTNIHSYELEVIGNMSDNPELLEFEVE